MIDPSVSFPQLLYAQPKGKVVMAAVQEDSKSNAVFTVHSDDHGSQSIHNDEEEILDISKPFPNLPNQPEEPVQFTLRALLVGTFLGAVVSASNMYLCLKTGWTFGASLFGILPLSLSNPHPLTRSQEQFSASQSSSPPALSSPHSSEAAISAPVRTSQSNP
jgi:hypothetical protein